MFSSGKKHIHEYQVITRQSKNPWLWKNLFSSQSIKSFQDLLNVLLSFSKLFCRIKTYFLSDKNRMKSGDNKMSDFGKNYLRAGAVRLVNVVISYRFEHLFFQTYFMQGGTCGSWCYKIINFLISPTEGGFCYFEFYYLMNSRWGWLWGRQRQVFNLLTGLWN